MEPFAVTKPARRKGSAPDSLRARSGVRRFSPPYISLCGLVHSAVSSALRRSDASACPVFCAAKLKRPFSITPITNFYLPQSKPLPAPPHPSPKPRHAKLQSWQLKNKSPPLLTRPNTPPHPKPPPDL